jgi:predicted cupin superfamily sugar epimerase
VKSSHVNQHLLEQSPSIRTLAYVQLIIKPEYQLGAEVNQGNLLKVIVPKPDHGYWQSDYSKNGDDSCTYILCHSLFPKTL